MYSRGIRDKYNYNLNMRTHIFNHTQQQQQHTHTHIHTHTHTHTHTLHTPLFEWRKKLQIYTWGSILSTSGLTHSTSDLMMNQLGYKSLIFMNEVCNVNKLVWYIIRFMPLSGCRQVPIWWMWWCTRRRRWQWESLAVPWDPFGKTTTVVPALF